MSMKRIKNEYDEQAEKFIEKTGLVIDKTYQGHRKYFTDDINQIQSAIKAGEGA